MGMLSEPYATARHIAEINEADRVQHQHLIGTPYEDPDDTSVTLNFGSEQLLVRPATSDSPAIHDNNEHNNQEKGVQSPVGVVLPRTQTASRPDKPSTSPTDRPNMLRPPSAGPLTGVPPRDNANNISSVPVARPVSSPPVPQPAKGAVSPTAATLASTLSSKEGSMVSASEGALDSRQEESANQVFTSPGGPSIDGGVDTAAVPIAHALQNSVQSKAAAGLEAPPPLRNGGHSTPQSGVLASY